MTYPSLLSRGALAISLIGATLPAAAARIEIQGGRSYMDSYGANSAFVEVLLDAHRIGDSRFRWSPDVSLGWIDSRHIDRFRYSRFGTNTAIWLVAGGARLHYGEPGDWYFPLFYSFQGALLSGRSQALSSTGQFVNTVGWQGQRWSFQIRHISNGGLHDPNRGETSALVGLAFDI
ncbi:acyloxyacyl hydrolase [Dyella tabacisoli]|uniref:Lipid A 3-O-deacylase n=1 Tax=Dyella tabacisoli TaxID=2282381 RepID=A0A369UJD8_9GAMM|nr:acyloxyacyl hydrolase [Dyella tabacisoli]RDD80862.1 lipid A 3-O-deacylase [Dyella tabacisoli]